LDRERRELPQLAADREGRGRLKKAALELHQATERFYHCLILVRTLYRA
jgi:hypothetical protein